MRFTHRQYLCVVIQVFILLVGAAQALAAQAQLAWDASDDSTPLGGYILYYWQESEGVRQSVDVGLQTTYTLDGLVDGATYSFMVTDYDLDGNESGTSNIVTLTMPSDPTQTPPPGPTLVSPPPDTTLPGSTVLFEWTDGGAAVIAWYVSVGSSVGANDLLGMGLLGSELSLIVDGLPTDGEAIFVRLWYVLGGTLQFSDFSYTAAPTP